MVLFEKLDKSLQVEFSGKEVILPPKLQSKIDRYWADQLAEGKKYHRGEGYHVIDVRETKDRLLFQLSLSDYAHYLYSRRVGLPARYSFCNIHTSCLIECLDKVLVFGVMGTETALAGNVQCVGGGLDRDDLCSRKFSLRHNIKKELLEEVGIDAGDKKIVRSLRLEYLCHYRNKKVNSYAAIFIAKLSISSKDFRVRYEKFVRSLAKKNELPEFGTIYYLPKNKTEILEFIKKHPGGQYMEKLLAAIVKKPD
jgi:predicted NUDIX family phosphoesterase